jgi:hypothetical protein
MVHKLCIMTKQLNLNYQVDIAEQGFVNGDFIIQGTAINSVVTSNNHKFLSEELSKSASSLKGVPLLKDHDNNIDSIMGRVLVGEFNEAEEKVDFKAKVLDENAKTMIKDGRLNTVSVGAVVEDIDEEDGFFIPRGITFKELSLVAVPADEGATFQIALKEAYNAQGDESQLNQQEVKKMSEEAEKETPQEAPAEEVAAPAEPEAEVAEEPAAEAAEPEVTEEKVKAWMKAAIKEADADEAEAAPEPKAEEPAEEEEAEEAEEEEVEEGALNIVRSSHNSFTLVR